MERAWLETFKDMDVELTYLNYKRTAQELGLKLKNEH
jgi:hypothetical protein